MPALRTNRGARAHTFHDRAAEVLIRAGIGQDTYQRLLPHARQCALLQLLPAALLRIFVCDREREEISGGAGFALDLEHTRQPPPVLRLEFTVVAQSRARDSRSFPRIPAL